eukprot:TRINITY_DN19437_c0_g1_i1.p1 TRINITY_DN19437_c0_g1~~TRINITY_DN19437_c0_g1_i1.p1  ORF type:complete len:586 (+),score=54.17 TRINITY_DN19437_c0_g1_i1:88-1845(+)
MPSAAQWGKYLCFVRDNSNEIYCFTENGAETKVIPWKGSNALEIVVGWGRKLVSIESGLGVALYSSKDDAWKRLEGVAEVLCDTAGYGLREENKQLQDFAGCIKGDCCYIHGGAEVSDTDVLPSPLVYQIDFNNREKKIFATTGVSPLLLNHTMTLVGNTIIVGGGHLAGTQHLTPNTEIFTLTLSTKAWRTVSRVECVGGGFSFTAFQSENSVSKRICLYEKNGLRETDLSPKGSVSKWSHSESPLVLSPLLYSHGFLYGVTDRWKKLAMYDTKSKSWVGGVRARRGSVSAPRPGNLRRYEPPKTPPPSPPAPSPPCTPVNRPILNEVKIHQQIVDDDDDDEVDFHIVSVASPALKPALKRSSIVATDTTEWSSYAASPALKPALKRNATTNSNASPQHSVAVNIDLASPPSLDDLPSPKSPPTSGGSSGTSVKLEPLKKRATFPLLEDEERKSLSAILAKKRASLPAVLVDTAAPEKRPRGGLRRQSVVAEGLAATWQTTEQKELTCEQALWRYEQLKASRMLPYQHLSLQEHAAMLLQTPADDTLEGYQVRPPPVPLPSPFTGNARCFVNDAWQKGKEGKKQ